MIRWGGDIPDGCDASRGGGDDALDPVIGGDLSRRGKSPDLTDSIMKRLGYERVDATAGRAERRRQRAQQWGRRLSVAAAASVALLVGAFIHRIAPDARHPSDISIPSAIEHDLNRHGQSVGQLIQTIRELTPAIDRSSAPSPVIGPSIGPGLESPNNSHAPESAIDPAASAPFQWV